MALKLSVNVGQSIAIGGPTVMRIERRGKGRPGFNLIFEHAGMIPIEIMRPEATENATERNEKPAESG